jgi:multiple sugar transport system permease protein/raffinose/stachyose/melibiose transport system permease protein
LILLLIVFLVLPILGSFVISLLDYNPLRETGNTFIWFDNFKRLLGNELFGISFKNTLTYVFIMVSINLVVTLLIAQLLTTLSSNKWRSLFRVLLFMPCVAPLAAVSVIWQKGILPTKGGLLNIFLSNFGVAPINWLGNASVLMPSLLIVSLWADIGYNIILFISGLQGIPQDYMDAAKIDGAGPIRRFWQVTFPLLGRTFSYVTAMTLISQFQAFAQFSILAPGGGIARAGYVLSTYIYDMGFGNKDMGFASAISLTLFLVILVVTLIQQRVNRVDWGY